MFDECCTISQCQCQSFIVRQVKLNSRSQCLSQIQVERLRNVYNEILRVYDLCFSTSQTYDKCLKYLRIESMSCQYIVVHLVGRKVRLSL
jgi:hypothetical protein